MLQEGIIISSQKAVSAVTAAGEGWTELTRGAASSSRWSGLYFRPQLPFLFLGYEVIRGAVLPLPELGPPFL